MRGLTVAQAARICGGVLNTTEGIDTPLGAIVIDSRAIQPGDVFAAYRGERVDGHAYISAALDKGAACCLAERVPEGETRPVIVVPDVQAAVEALGAAWRESLSLPVVGVTGSVGKTSAKEMIAAVLSSRFPVLKTEGNLNNQIGVPMTVSRIEREHEAAVVELGISGFGEMTALARIARPTIAVYTVIGHAHLEFLHDLEGVFRAKTEMLPFLPADGAVVVNGDDPWLRTITCPQRLLRVGLGEDNDLQAVDVHADSGGTAFTALYEGRAIPLHIPAYGKHLIYAALEGAAVGLLLGMRDDEIAAGVERFAIVGRRGAVADTGRFTLIDDSYNANPDSIQCGLDSLAGLPGRSVAILGDMLEMGPESAAMHVEVGRYAREKGVGLLLCSGPLGRYYAEGAGDIARYFETAEELIAALPSLLLEGDTVLVKASRGMRFERIAEAIKTL